MKIIDNFLSKTYYNSISEQLTGPSCEWWYNNNISNTPFSTDFNEYGFSHTFWHEKTGQTNAPLTHFIQPLLFQILDATDCDFLLRGRVDMVTWSGKEDFIYPAHIDFIFPNIASIFYVNETDGDTIFYNVKQSAVAHYKDLKEYDRVSPKANRLVLFDGDFLHTGCSPIKHKNRILINSNYIKKEIEEKIRER